MSSVLTSNDNTAVQFLRQFHQFATSSIRIWCLKFVYVAAGISITLCKYQKSFQSKLAIACVHTGVDLCNKKY